MALDVVVVGAGAAGSALAWRIATTTSRRVVLLEPPVSSDVGSPDRTWCFWEVGDGDFDDLLSASWDDVVVVGRTGSAQRLALAPFRYKMLSSECYLAAMAQRLDDAGVERRVMTVDDVWETPADGPRVRGRDGDGVEVVIDDAELVFDTRPTPPATNGSVALLQHFRGWFVRTKDAQFDPSAAVLMDFRTAQPRNGVSFGYVLPTSPTTALVEYTEFTRARLTDDAYDHALSNYLTRILGIDEFEIDAVEDGAIPMTDASFARRIGAHTFRLGAAGGATRPSTGYTFAAAQRQASGVAVALAAGVDPVPPPAYPRRHLAMDSLMLRAIDSGRIGGADFFSQLFADHPPERVLRFLDGATTPGEEIAIMRSAPRAPMMRTVFSR